MTTRVQGGGFEFSVCSVGGNWEWRIVADNVRGAGQLYAVDRIRTPFGPLSQANIPIPSEVILAMADSLTQFQQQLQPQVMLSSGSIFNLTVTEGDPVSSVGTVVFTNVGAFGSFMSVTAAPSSPWLSVDPSAVSGIDKNRAGQVAVRINPGLLVAGSSPYVGHVNIQDNANNVVTVPVNVTVLPRPSIQLSAPSLTLAFYLSSMASGGAIPLTITNAGTPGSTLSFTLAKVQNQSPWLQMLPLNAGPIPAGDTANITFSLVEANVPRVPGMYVETIRVVSPNASNSPQEITVNLQINP